MNQVLFNQTVNRFKTTVNQDQENSGIHYFYYCDDTYTYSHRFNDYQKPCDVRSISKTVMALITGIVIDEKTVVNDVCFDQDTYIYPLIKDLITLENKDNLPYLKKIQVKHLLNHTVGFDEVLMMRDDIKDRDPFTYLDYIVNAPLVYEPGQYYLYSNAGFYLLSVVLQTVLDEPLIDYIKLKLFDPLEIKTFNWEKYGDYLAGATRLWLYPEDLAKLGLLILQDGRYHHKQVISKAWLDYLQTEPLKTPQVDNPNRLFRRYAYGKGLWLAKDKNIIFAHGTDGQTLIVVPDKKAVIVTLSQQNDVYELEGILDDFLKSLYL